MREALPFPLLTKRHHTCHSYFTFTIRNLLRYMLNKWNQIASFWSNFSRIFLYVHLVTLWCNTGTPKYFPRSFVVVKPLIWLSDLANTSDVFFEKYVNVLFALTFCPEAAQNLFKHSSILLNWFSLAAEKWSLSSAKNRWEIDGPCLPILKDRHACSPLSLLVYYMWQPF